MTITPGQSLTPEQVRNLPDGAVVRMHKSDRPYLELTVKNGELDIPNCSYNDTQPKGWFALPLATYRWESCLLVSLPPAPSEPGSRIEPQAEPANPELPVWVITCDRCGTTYKNNERHACAAREPAKIVIQESGIISKSTYESLLPEHHTRAACEPAKPDRQASEIEKRAAVALLENCKSSIVERVDSGFNASLRISCEWYIEAYDYAKSIGAIE